MAMIQLFRRSTKRLHRSIVELIETAHCQRLDREPRGSCEDAPSRIRSGEPFATLPIDHIDDGGSLQLHETPAASSGQQ